MTKLHSISIHLKESILKFSRFWQSTFHVILCNKYNRKFYCWLNAIDLYSRNFSSAAFWYIYFIKFRMFNSFISIEIPDFTLYSSLQYIENVSDFNAYFIHEYLGVILNSFWMASSNVSNSCVEWTDYEVDRILKKRVRNKVVSEIRFLSTDKYEIVFTSLRFRLSTS